MRIEAQLKTFAVAFGDARKNLPERTLCSLMVYASCISLNHILKELSFRGLQTRRPSLHRSREIRLKNTHGRGIINAQQITTHQLRFGISLPAARPQ